MLVTASALVVALSFNPLGKGIESYDFSTPEAAAKSRMQIVLNQDFQAFTDIRKIETEGELREQVDTLKVNRVESFGDEKLVFISYMRGGKEMKDVLAYEENLKLKMWIKKHVDEKEIEKTDPELLKKIRDWEKI